MVDLRRSKRTAYEKVWFIKRLLKNVNKKPSEISREDLRGFLRTLENYSAATYKNALMALKVFFRDYLEKPELVSSFRFPHQVFKPKQIVSKEQVKQFYTHLETPKEKALFMLYATTGLRREEILLLEPEDIDFENRMITPNNHLGETKKSWVSFYNQEADNSKTGDLTGCEYVIVGVDGYGRLGVWNPITLDYDYRNCDMKAGNLGYIEWRVPLSSLNLNGSPDVYAGTVDDTFSRIVNFIAVKKTASPEFPLIQLFGLLAVLFLVAVIFYKMKVHKKR